VLVWNVQFCGSRRHRFFYDGGRAVSVPEGDVRGSIAAMSAALRQEVPDLVVLQEVDRDSRRTRRIDQHAALLEAGGWASHASTPYHRVRYVPYPNHEHLGRVDMALSVFSRFHIAKARHHPLPLLKEGRVRQWFNLRRAALELHLPVAGGGTLRLFDTHLSAFSRGDGTLAAQIAVLDSLLCDAEREGAWLLAGDLNALPPGDDPRRLPDPQEYPEATSPVARLLERYRSPVAADPCAERWRTYLPFGLDAPDRTLDWVFHGSGVQITGFEVLRAYSALSDHLPVRFDLVVT
jgi:endonuclease/exonuclease/phosphatase family metal-dependent hydrolase